MQISDTFAVQFGFGDHDMSGYQGPRRSQLVIQTGLLAQEHDVLLKPLVNHHADGITHVQHTIGICHHVRAVRVHQTRDDEMDVAVLRQLFQTHTVHLRIRQTDIDMLDLILLLLGGIHFLFLFIQRHAEDPLERHQREDDTDYAQGIGHGISGCDIRITCTTQIGIRLFGSTQTRRVRHGSAEHTYRRSDIQTRTEVNDIRHSATQQHDRCRHQVHFQTLFSKRREETRAHLQADRINEQDQAQVLGKGLH